MTVRPYRTYGATSVQTDQMYRVSPAARAWSSLSAPLLLVALALVCLWPLAWYGYPWNTDDAHYHAIYAQQFLHELLAGTLDPRWLTGMNNGLGAPIFFFYGPVPYWITSLAGLLTGVRDGFALLAMGAVAVLIASGLSAYAWLRSLVPCWPAAIGAALYVVLPYHLTVDLWTRSAFAEFNAYLWIPLLFLAIEQMRVGRAMGLPLFAATFGLLIATHIITAMLVSGMAAAYMVLRFSNLRNWARAAAGVALGAGLAAAYLGPALGLRSQVHIPVHELDLSAFLWSSHAPLGREGLWNALNALAVGEMVAGLLLLASSVLFRRGTERRLVLAWSILTLLSVLGTTTLFAPIWWAFPVLQNAQFPFRLNTIADLGFATLAALLSGLFLVKARRPGWLAAAALATMVIAGIAQVAVPIARGNFDRAHARGPAILAVQGDSLMFRPLPSMSKLPSDESPPRAVSLPMIQIVAGQATATIVSQASRKFTIVVDAVGPATLRLGQLYFTGWQARTGERLLPVRPSADMGLVELDVPPGRYELIVELGRGVLERGGIAVSTVAAMVWLSITVFAWRRNK
jgi:hypothetical protein